MALTINTNIASLNAQRNLGKSQNALAKSMQRLSSGLRINSAKDDAAGLAISNRMTAQIRGLNQAARNANDGISMAQTAEGALQESTNILQRMREIAVQSANDTNTSTDRTSLQAEVSELISELDRIATSTKFNGQSLLDGTFANTKATFHVGADANQTIGFNVADAQASALGTAAAAAAGSGEVTAVDGTATIAGYSAAVDITSLANASGTLSVDGAAISWNTASVSQLNSAKNIAAALTTAGYTATAGNASFNMGAFTGSGNQVDNLWINGVAATGEVFNNEGEFKTWVEGNVANVAYDTATHILSTTDGSNLDVISWGVDDGASWVNMDTDAGSTQYHTSIGSVDITGSGELVIDNTLDAGTYGIAITAGTTGNDASAAVAATPETVTMDSVNVTDQAGANTAIASIDLAIAEIDSSRGGLGAVQNRFESTISNLQNVAENLSAARSRILDADIAQETSAMTKNNILQQAGVSILAQANQAPQLALSLLQ